MNKKGIFALLIASVALSIAIFTKLTQPQHPSDYPLEHNVLLDALDPIALEKGRKIMNQQKVIITGITRDDAAHFFKVRRHLEFLASQFADYRIVIFENDSKDNTKDNLAKWAEEDSKVTIINKDFGIVKRPSIQFLAEARNFYIDEISKTEYNDYNILIVIDMDMSYGFDIRGIYDSFAKWNYWDVVASNGVDNKEGRMYDAFAFRNEEFPWSHNDKPDTYWGEIIPQIQRSYPVGAPLVPVYSAFGGLAIYKREKIKDCRYQSIDEDCEHIEFHNCIRKNGGRIVLNPSQYLRYQHYTDN